MRIVLIILILFPISLSSQIVTWQGETEYEFGDLVQHQPEEVDFTFVNTSSDTLLIDNVRSTCGCTAPYWDLTPILPDSASQIRIKYDSYKAGYFHKKIKVFFNKQRKAERLSISGRVIPAERPN